MNNNLSNVLNSIGISPHEFTTQPSQTSITPSVQITSNPATIEEALSNSSIYATIQEQAPIHEVQLSENDCNDILASVGVVIPDAEDSLAQEITDIESNRNIEAVVTETPTVETTPISPTPPTEPTSSTDFIESAPPTVDQIPLNPPTLTLDDSTSRFSGANWYENIQKTKIIIAGIGGIGSNLAYQIARLNPAKIVLYDDDIVEIANLSGQFFASSDVGMYKADAIAKKLKDYTVCSNIYSITEQFTSISAPCDIMMCGFDSMRARRNYFAAWRYHVQSLPIEKRKDCLFLDGRLSIDTLQVFAIAGDDEYSMNLYKNKYLFSDEQAEHTICSLKQTTYLACMIAAIMTNIFINFIANFSLEVPYTIPFFTEYDAINMLFSIKNV